MGRAAFLEAQGRTADVRTFALGGASQPPPRGASGALAHRSGLVGPNRCLVRAASAWWCAVRPLIGLVASACVARLAWRGATMDYGRGSKQLKQLCRQPSQRTESDVGALVDMLAHISHFFRKVRRRRLLFALRSWGCLRGSRHARAAWHIF